MTRRLINVEAGQQFGRLTVLEEVRRITPSKPIGIRAARCQCQCGNQVVVMLFCLTSGNSQSCGCLKREKLAAARRTPGARLAMSERYRTHGLYNHPLYGTHRAMMWRCHNPRHHAFKNYGARGIAVCPDWHDIAVFVAWIEANLGPRPDGMTLDRINNDGNYEPGNVQWATWPEQRRNQRRNQRPLSRALGDDRG